MAEENVTLAFIGMHLERLTTEVASLCDDWRPHSNLLTEVGSVHSQISRMNDQLRKVEDKELG
jgi:hypothetical protein